MLSNFNQKSLGILITAGALGLGLMLGSGHGFAQDAAKKDAPTGPQAKDTKEFNEASTAQQEKDDNKRLAELDQWKKDYPTTELVDARNKMYLATYANLKMARQAFDMAQEVLKTAATNVTALADAIQFVMAIKPAPTAADLDTAEKNVMTILDNPAVFADKPAGVTDAAWAGQATNIKDFAKRVLLAIYVERDKADNKRATDDITHLINRDPNMAIASYQLGTIMQAEIKASNNIDALPSEFWQFARAIDGTGNFALPAATKTGATKFLTDAYTNYHGSTEGLQDLLAQAKNSPFPPAGWSLKSKVDIAKDQIAKDEANRAADPLGTLWREDIKGNLIKDGGDAFFDANIKGAGLPGPDPNDHSDKPADRFFNATIVSMTPATNPKELLVGVEKPDVADAKLVFEKALPGKMEPGEKIQFKGVPDSFTKDPFMITFKLDDAKEDMNETWTGKAAVRARGAVNTKGTGAGRGATGGGAKSTSAPKSPATK